MATTIQIHTRLHDGIYRSSGGGEDISHYEWAVGPRNLLSAVAELSTHCQSMRAGYGNIGCGVSWIEIAGERIDPSDICEIESAAAIREMDDSGIRHCGPRSPTPTQVARDLLAEIAAGTYRETRRRYAAELRAEYDARRAHDDAEMERQYAEDCAAGITYP